LPGIGDEAIGGGAGEEGDAGAGGGLGCTALTKGEEGGQQGDGAHEGGGHFVSGGRMADEGGGCQVWRWGDGRMEKED
jgi:hypothetical protein